MGRCWFVILIFIVRPDCRHKGLPGFPGGCSASHQSSSDGKIRESHKQVQESWHRMYKLCRSEHNFTPQTMCTYLSTKPRCRWNGYSGKRWVLMFRSLRKEDSLEEGEPFLVAVARLCNAGYIWCAIVQSCDCAIVRLCDCVLQQQEQRCRCTTITTVADDTNDSLRPKVAFLALFRATPRLSHVSEHPASKGQRKFLLFVGNNKQESLGLGECHFVGNECI